MVGVKSVGARSCSVTDFKKLKVWQKAHVMALDVHRIAGQIRGAKHASLRSQILRAAMSVPTNIVEGCGQQTTREFSRFLRIALNSTSELEYHLLAARDLHGVRASDSLTLISQVIEVRKMLYGLLHYLKSRSEGKSEAPEKETTHA
jgi:four helix bundle protein